MLDASAKVEPSGLQTSFLHCGKESFGTKIQHRNIYCFTHAFYARSGSYSLEDIRKTLPDAFPTIDENSSLDFLISITFSCSMARTRPLSPMANFQGKV